MLFIIACTKQTTPSTIAPVTTNNPASKFDMQAICNILWHQDSTYNPENNTWRTDLNGAFILHSYNMTSTGYSTSGSSKGYWKIKNDTTILTTGDNVPDTTNANYWTIQYIKPVGQKLHIWQKNSSGKYISIYKK